MKTNYKNYSRKFEERKTESEIPTMSTEAWRKANPNLETNEEVEVVKKKPVIAPTLHEVTNCGHLNVRKDKDLGSPVVTILKAGTKVLALDTDTKVWAKVGLDSESLEGYVLKEYIKEA